MSPEITPPTSPIEQTPFSEQLIDPADRKPELDELAGVAIDSTMSGSNPTTVQDNLPTDIQISAYLDTNNSQETPRFLAEGSVEGSMGVLGPIVERQVAEMQKNPEDRLGKRLLGNTMDRGSVTAEVFLKAIKDKLAAVIERSKDPDLKARSSAKNSAEVLASRGFFTAGDYMHATRGVYLEGILSRGILSGDLIGKAKEHVGLTRLEADFTQIGNEQNTKNSTANISGADVIIKIRRDTEATEYGEDDGSDSTGVTNGHMTIAVGVPSSEISGIHVLDKHHDKVIEKVIANGQYIPVYDLDGNLALTVEQFEEQSGVPVKRVEFKDERIDSQEVEAFKDEIFEDIISLARTAQDFGSHSYYTTYPQAVGRYQFGVKYRDEEVIGVTGSGPTFGRLSSEKGDTGSPITGVCIPIGAEHGETLQILKKGDVHTMFVSSIEKGAKVVSEEDVPVMRELVQETLARFRLGYATKLEEARLLEEKNKSGPKTYPR